MSNEKVTILIWKFKDGNQGFVSEQGIVERKLRNVHTRVQSEGGCCSRAMHRVVPVVSICGKDYFVAEVGRAQERYPHVDYEVSLSSREKLPVDLQPLPEGE